MMISNGTTEQQGHVPIFSCLLGELASFFSGHLRRAGLWNHRRAARPKMEGLLSGFAWNQPKTEKPDL